MKLRKNKKGFTIIELVIVIAVVGILTAILVPVFINLTQKANEASDQSLVKNLNNAMAIQEVDGKKNQTYHDAIEYLDGYGFKLANLATKSEYDLLRNSKSNRFLLNEQSAFEKDQKETGATDIEYWTIKDSIPAGNKFSIYAGLNYNEENPVNVDGIGFDAGDHSFSEINYSNTSGSKKDVVIRTNSLDTALTINAASDTVKHYATVGSINIIAVANQSYHEYGTVAFAEIKTGRIALEPGSQVSNIHLTATNGEFDDITIAKAEDVELPDFTRDPIEIPEGGAKIVALQDGTEADADKDYIWLTAVGIYEQVTVSSSKTAAGDNYAATSETVSDEKKETAQQIANNIVATVYGYDYTVKAEKVGDEWVYTLEGESEDKTELVANCDIDVTAESQVTVMNGDTPVITTTTVENGIDESEKDHIKYQAINEVEGVLSFTASIEDIGVNYYVNYEYLQPNDSKQVTIDEYTISIDLNTYSFGAYYVSTDPEVADATIETVVYCGFDEYTLEEYYELDDDEKEDCEFSLSLTLNAKTAGKATITVTYYNLEDESMTVDVTYHIFVSDTQVKIGETVYNSLEAAVAAAQNGDTIKLFKDIGGSTLDISTGYLPGVSIGHSLSYTTDSVETQLKGVKDLVLDLNGYSINAGSMYISNTNLEIIDSSNEKTGIVNAPIIIHFNGNTASFTWNSYSGTYEETSITYDDPTVVTFTGGTIKRVDLDDHTKVVVNGSRIVNNEESKYYGYGFGVGAYNALSGAQIEIRSGIVYGTETDVRAQGPNNTVTVTGGAFHFDPSDYVDLSHYNVAPNADGSLWLVTAK